ncbi:hypothetical protein ACFVR2_07440 [Gottfriedia sp. NPDC057991]|uniref:hypothetical protein n=1 Tax=Gottfriedia sp. NPDC057991 TaxID=3346298 RepID=UPI0036D8207F
MTNQFYDHCEQLSPVTFEILYKKIIEKIPQLSMINNYKTILFGHNLLAICREIAEEIGSQTNTIHQLFKLNENVQLTTLNFLDKEYEHKKIKQLDSAMKDFVDKKLFEKANQTTTEKPIIHNLPFVALERLIIERGNINDNELDVSMKNINMPVQLSKLAYNKLDNISSSNVLRHDDVSIRYQTKELLMQIKQSLIRYIEQHLDYEDDHKELIIDEIQSEDAIAKELYEFIETSHFASIKRTSTFLYLSYLLDSMNSEFIQKHTEAYELLSAYVNRYEQFESVCTKLLKEARCQPLEIVGEKRDLLNDFRHQDVYSFLPFIGKLSQVMARTRSEKNQTEQYGIALKLNGSVMKADGIGRSNQKSFTYQKNKIEKIAKYGASYGKTIATCGNLEKLVLGTERQGKNDFWFSSINIILFKFFLVRLNDPTYNPEKEFMKDIEQVQQLDGTMKMEKVHQCYQALAGSFLGKNESQKIEKKLDLIRTMFVEFLNPKLNQIQESVKKTTYKRRMVFFKSILGEKLFSPDRKTNLKNELQTHNYKYTALMNEEIEDSLFSFEYELEFRNKFLTSTNETLKTNVTYDVGEEDAATVMLIPYIYDREAKKYGMTNECLAFLTNMRSPQRICIPYLREWEYEGRKETASEFMFYFVYKMVVMLFLKNLLSQYPKEKQKLFVGLWHFYQNQTEDWNENENIIHQFVKELEFIFGMDFQTGSQGLNFVAMNPYKTRNAKTSMYSRLKKEFHLEEPITTQKIAILTLTSMKCDSVWKGDAYKAGLFGEIYTVDSEGNKSQIRRRKTFFDHNNEQMYQNPKLLVDVVRELYEKGYKDILYVAKTPYTTKFIDKKEGQKELYFMSQEIMKALNFASDLSVYPVHYNLTSAYESRQEKGTKNIALYVDDTSHIQQYLYGQHEGIVPIAQFYTGNGLKGQQGRNVYNSMITYQTWAHIYDDKVLNNKIQNALINPKGEKPDLIKALVLLHTSHFEASQNVTIKIDPYKELIGDEGVAKRSLWEVNQGRNRMKMNQLTYFSYVYNQVMKEEVEGAK